MILYHYRRTIFLQEAWDRRSKGEGRRRCIERLGVNREPKFYAKEPLRCFPRWKMLIHF